MKTRKPMHVIAIGAGLVALLLGLVATHDFFAAPANRLLGGPFARTMFLGPALIAAGTFALLAPAVRRRLWINKPGDRRASIRGGFLKLLGGTLILASVALLVLGAITGSEVIGFYSSMSLFLLALPGLVLFLLGFLVARKPKQNAA